MDNQPAKNPCRNPLARLWPWWFVLLVILFVGFIRVRLLEMPLERDEGEYAYAGQLILQGVPPYELAYNMKLPGTYYAYALGMAVFGQTIAGIHLMLLAVNALTIIFVFLLGRKLFGVLAGLVACAGYGVMSASVLVQGHEAHATHFVVLCAVPAILTLLQAEKDRNRGLLFVSGLLFGLAFLMKQQGICFCLFAVCFLVWNAVAGKSIFTAGFAGKAAILGAGMLLPFAVFCLACVIAGDFARFWFWTFIYARKYVELLPWSAGAENLFLQLQQDWNVFLGLWLLAIIGLPLAWWNKAFRKQILLTVLLLVFSFLGTAIGFYFRSHYFILMLPALALLIGAAVVSLQRILQFGPMKNVLQTLPVILYALILSWVIYYQSQVFFQLPPLRICRALYLGNPFLEAVPVAQYIQEHSAPDARIAVIGSEPEIYFYAHRHSATGYIYTYALMEPQPAALAMQHEMMAEIETNRPEYIVSVPYYMSWLYQKTSDHTILQWVGQYLPEFYEIVGVVGYNNQGELVSVWGDALTNAPVFPGEYIRVYRRKAGPGPAGAN